ncbi:MAG: dihydroorotate dehydrogenase [Rhodospirillaceae bacterium]|nr:dihydroorotate dehydrogenase [Rhodospirillaceae bacterium]
MVDLSVDIGSLKLANPIMPGSGTFSEGMAQAVDLNRIGALVAKTITPEIRDGNRQPRVVELKNGMIASIGIPSKGPEYFIREIVPFYDQFTPPFVASISANSAEEFGELSAQISVEGVAAIEVNISCPNLKRDGAAFGMSCEDTAAVVKAIKQRTDLPIWAKLTPNVGNIGEIAQAAESAGAEALVVANALLAMAVDTETFRPKLGNVMGGITGPVVKPIIVRMAYQCAKAVDIPVIGCGGITTVSDVAEYMLVGCTAVQVGTASFVHPTAMTDIIDGLVPYLEAQGLSSVTDLIGAMIEPENDAAGMENAPSIRSVGGMHESSGL